MLVKIQGFLPVGLVLYLASDVKQRYFLGKSSIYTIKLLQKSNFQPTTKPDNRGHPTWNRANLAHYVVSNMVFHFVRIENIQI